eukprot:gene20046-26761_t
MSESAKSLSRASQRSHSSIDDPLPVIKSNHLCPFFTPKTNKFNNDLATKDTVASSRPATRPATRESGWMPNVDVDMPAHLSFESWWFESGQRVGVKIDYNTATGICTASAHVSVAAKVTTQRGDETIDPWCLHVGAKINILGRSMTLKKATNLTTMTWLDKAAHALLKEKHRLEKELRKYCQVTIKTGQFHHTQRAEPYDGSLSEQVPKGGRVNLANLRKHVLELMAQLRKHQRVLPQINGCKTVGSLRTTTPELQGPECWDATGGPLRARSHEGRLRSKEQVSPLSTQRKDPMEWITEIPLAASAAGLQRQNGVYVDPVSLQRNVTHGASRGPRQGTALVLQDPSALSLAPQRASSSQVPSAHATARSRPTSGLREEGEQSRRESRAGEQSRRESKAGEHSRRESRAGEQSRRESREDRDHSLADEDSSGVGAPQPSYGPASDKGDQDHSLASNLGAEAAEDTEGSLRSMQDQDHPLAADLGAEDGEDTEGTLRSMEDQDQDHPLAADLGAEDGEDTEGTLRSMEDQDQDHPLAADLRAEDGEDTEGTSRSMGDQDQDHSFADEDSSGVGAPQPSSGPGSEKAEPAESGADGGTDADGGTGAESAEGDEGSTEALISAGMDALEEVATDAGDGDGDTDAGNGDGDADAGDGDGEADAGDGDWDGDGTGAEALGEDGEEGAGGEAWAEAQACKTVFKILAAATQA